MPHSLQPTALESCHVIFQLNDMLKEYYEGGNSESHGCMSISSEKHLPYIFNFLPI